MKRSWLVVIVIILAVAAVFFYYRRSGENPFFKDTSLYKAVPVSVPVFVEIGSLKAIPAKNKEFCKWLEFKDLIKFTEWIQLVDSTIRENGNIQSGLRNDRFIVALSFPGGRNPVPLVIMKAESSNRKSSFEVLFHALFPESSFVYSEIDYTGYKIISALSSDNKRSVYYCFSDGLVLTSPSQIMVQQALLQLSEPGLTENSSFKELTSAMNSEPEIAWYLNQQLFPDILADYINQSSLTEKNEFSEETKQNHYRNLQSFKKYADWSELEISFDETSLQLKGITIADDSLNHFLSVFKGQSSRSSDAPDVLPRNTAFYTSFIFSDKKVFFKNLEEYFSMAGSFYKREDLIRKMNRGLKTDLRKSFQTVSGNELIMALTDIPPEADKRGALFLMGISGKRKTEKLLDSMLTNYAVENGKRLEDLKKTVTIDKKKEFEVYEFPFPSFPGVFFGRPFISVKARVAVIYGDFLVFANSAQVLQDYLSSLENDESLSSDRRYKRIKSNASSISNINVYLNLNSSTNLVPELFTSDIAKKLTKNKDVLNLWQAFNWQVTVKEDFYENSINLIFDDGKTDEDESGIFKNGTIFTSSKQRSLPVLWQAKPGSAVVARPVLTVNHNDKVNREIMVQDKSNKLYQLTNKGIIRWSFDAGNPIISEIYQIDYLANGKLQYLFSTKNKLFILDRKGVALEGFPVNFPAEATTGVSVFDYDNNRIYRYFVPCADKKIYAFSKEGKPLEGWKFEGTKTPVVSPVKHFRVKGKDFIVFKDKTHIYIQNRKGEPVAKTAAEFENSQNPLILDTSGEPRIVATDSDGKIYLIGFDGNYVEKNVGKFSDDHFFLIDDLNGDKKHELIFADENVLTVLSEEGTIVFTQKVAGEILFSPQVFRFGPKQKKIGVTDSKGQIYLFDEKGQLQPGFPLPGNTNFSIGKISQNADNLNLVVGNKNGSVVCYGL